MAPGTSTVSFTTHVDFATGSSPRSVAVGDLNGDGRADIVAGGFHILEPFDRPGRVTMWLSRKGAP